MAPNPSMHVASATGPKRASAPSTPPTTMAKPIPAETEIRRRVLQCCPPSLDVRVRPRKVNSGTSAITNTIATVLPKAIASPHQHTVGDNVRDDRVPKAS